MPSKLPMTGVRLEEDLLAKLEYLKDRDGIPYNEQMRRALKLWFAEKGVPEEVRRHHKKGGRG